MSNILPFPANPLVMRPEAPADKLPVNALPAHGVTHKQKEATPERLGAFPTNLPRLF